MIEDYTVALYEDEIYETHQEGDKKRHHPLDEPYFAGSGSRAFSFSPGRLSRFPIFDDVKVFKLYFYGKADDNEDDREAWADPIRMEVLRRLRYKDWSWYIAADGWCQDPDHPDNHLTLDQHLQNLFTDSLSMNTAQVRSFPEVTGKVEGGKWVWTTKPDTRAFYEISYQHIETICSVIWENAVPGSPIEGYQHPPGSLNILREWGELPLDEKLFRQVIDACRVIFYAFPAEHRHFSFLTNKWSLEDMQKMLDLPSLQAMADQIKAQLSK